MSDLLDAVPDILVKMLEGISEASSLVVDLGLPDISETPADLHVRLLTTRAAMTRVSDLCNQIVRLRSRIKQVVIDREGELEDAEATVLSTDNKKAFVEEFSSAKERNAKLAAKTLNERMRLRSVKKVMADIEGCYEYAKNKLWEFDRSVRDIDTRLRIMVYEPNIH